MDPKNKRLKFLSSSSWTTIGPMILHLSLAVPLSSALCIWVDEVYTMHTIRGSLGYTLGRALNFEMQPPLYFLLMNLWAKLGSSVFFLRLFSLLCVILMIGVTSRISRRVFPEIHPGWLTTAVAVNPYSIWASTEIRLYAFLALLSAVVFLTFYEGFLLDDASSSKKRKWFFLFCVLSFYTQYYMVFVFAALFLALLILKKWDALKRLLVSYLCVGAFSLPIFMAALRQTMSHMRFIRIHNDILNYLSVGTRFLRYPLRLDWMPATIYMIFYALCLSGMLIVILKYRKSIQARHGMIWIMTLAITAFFLVIMNILNYELVSITHSTVLFLPSLLALFSIASIIPDRKRKRVLILIFLLTLAANAAYLLAEYRSMAKFGDFERVAEFITQRESPGQDILVFTSNEALPFTHYYAGKNVVIPIPHVASETSYDVNDFVLKSEQELVAAIERKGVPPDRIWVITRSLCQYIGVDFHCSILEEYLDKNFTIEDDKKFYGSRARLVRRTK